LLKKVTAVTLSSALMVLGVATFGTGAESSGATLPPAPSRFAGVAVVGDSLAWQADASIKSTLSSFGPPFRGSVNPGHGLSTPWAQATLRDDLHRGLYKVLVVETASNDAALAARGSVPVAEFEGDLARLAGDMSGRCLVVMTAKVNVDLIYYHPSAALEVNRAIRVVAAEHQNVRVIDWNRESENHHSWFSADLLHLAPGMPGTVSADAPPSESTQTTADRAFALALRAGVDSCSASNSHEGV
jgi:hypothetical protein